MPDELPATEAPPHDQPGGQGGDPVTERELAAAYRDALADCPDALGPAAGQPAGVDAGLAAGPSGTAVSVAALVETATSLLRMVDRAAARSLYADAFRVSRDPDWSAAIADKYQWSDAELTEVGTLLHRTLEMYGMAGTIRPDIVLLLACGTHAAGFLAIKAQIRGRAKPAAPPQPQTTP